jgi:exocyst complex protein 7
VKYLDAQGKRLVLRAGTSEADPLQTGREFGEWDEVILATADVSVLFVRS